MIGKKRRGQEELFLYCSLRDLVPDDYILKRVDKVQDCLSSGWAASTR